MIYSYEAYKKIFELSNGYPVVYYFVKRDKDNGVVLECSNLLFRHRKDVVEYLKYRIAAQPNECMLDFSIEKSILMCRWPATINWEESLKRKKITYDDFD